MTINLGLRWEGLGMGTELLNRIANYYPDFAAAGKNPFVFPKDVNVGGFTGIGAGNAVDNCVIDNCRDINNFAPRVGFAYDLFGNHQTVIRGGYGMYYQRLSNQTTLQNSLAPPFNVQPIESRTDGSTNLPLQLANPFPNLPVPALVNLAVVPQNSIFTGLSGTGTPLYTNEAGQLCANFGGTAGNCSINFATFTTPRRNFHAPYNQQWNLMVQRAIAGGWALEAGYVGAHYVGGIGIFNPFVKLAAPTPTDIVPGVITAAPITVTSASGQSFTLTNNVGNIALRSGPLGFDRSRGARYNGNIGFALYNALQTTLSHRFQHGLYFQAAYTWSKTIDNVSGSMSTDELNTTRNGQGGAGLFDFGNIVPALNRSLSDFDRRHRLAISYSYDLPMPNTGIWGSQVFQGWTISGITYFQSGLPFTPSAQANASAWGSGGNASPLFACSSVDAAYTQGTIQSRLNQYINPACFADIVPAPNSGASLNYGNTRRNAFRGPFQQDFDFSLGKRFTFAERHTLRFRTDFFNMFNHPIFRAPSSVSIASRGTFGQITQTVIPSRLIQMNLKYEF